MPERDVIEPDRLERLRMPDDRGPHLSSAQAITRLPLRLDTSPAAVSFYFRFMSRVKTALPGQAHALAEVAHQHPALLVEALSDARINAFKYTPHIGNRSFSAAVRRLNATEPDQLGPSRYIRQLIMESNGLVGWVFSRRVDVLAHL